MFKDAYAVEFLNLPPDHTEADLLLVDELAHLMAVSVVKTCRAVLGDFQTSATSIMLTSVRAAIGELPDDRIATESLGRRRCGVDPVWHVQQQVGGQALESGLVGSS